MKRIPVVIGIIFNDTRDRVLLSVRAAGLTQSGLWEFPGGKLEAGETILQGLRRELFEETNIIVESAHHLLKIDHDYAELGIRLHAWVVDSWSGVPRGKEGQKVEWMPVKNLAEIPFPAANKRLIQVVTLPQLYLITPDREIYNDDFLNQVKQFDSSQANRFASEFPLFSPIDHWNRDNSFSDGESTQATNHL